MGRKGLYAKARAGIIPDFTGVSDPYEAPEDAEIEIDTMRLTPEQAAQEILLHLEREGFVGGLDAHLVEAPPVMGAFSR